MRLLDMELEARQEALVSLAEGFIRIDSQIPPYANELRMAGALMELLNERGIEAKLAGNVVSRPSVIARVPGGDGPVLGLVAHIDTKPVGEARSLWESEPLEPTIRDGYLYGLGSVDMKGAAAAMITAVDAVNAIGPTPGDIVLAFVADEEAGGAQGARLIAAELDDVAAALIGEPSGWERDWQGLHLVSRGSSCFTIRVHGTQGHSSLSDRMPLVNASVKAAELMVAMEEELTIPFRPHPIGNTGPTLNRGVLVKGGTWFGVVPGVAEFSCDLRTVPGMSFEEVDRELSAWITLRMRQDPMLQVEYEFEPGLEWVPPSHIEDDHPLVLVTEAAARDVLGVAPPRSVFPGATDAPWFTAAGIPTVPSFGPGLISVAHGPNERVSLQSLHEAAKMYARICMTFGEYPRVPNKKAVK